MPLLAQLSRDNLGALLNFSVEMIEGKQSTTAGQGNTHSAIVDALIESIDVAADFAKRPAWADHTSEEEKAQILARPSRDGSTMVAIKVSGILRDPSVLERASAAIVSREYFSAPPHPFPPSNVNGRYSPCAGLAIPVAALSRTDIDALQELWRALQKLAKRAEQVQNVRITIDAEYSWFQPAIDALYEGLAAEFNRVPSSSARRNRSKPQGSVEGPLIFNTYQAYLRRTPSYLAASLERARKNGYSLGVKLVRGAYVESENAQWAGKLVEPPRSSGSGEHSEWRSPVWPNKALTDACFDGCAARLVDEIALEMRAKPDRWPRLSVIFATHNWQSALKVTRRMLQVGLAHAAEEEDADLVRVQVAPGVRGRIIFGQLLGMADSLTRRLQLAFDPYSGGSGPHMALKYVPYGPLDLVMPYLVRRSVENKAVLQGNGKEEGAATQERKLAGHEIRMRLLPFGG